MGCRQSLIFCATEQCGPCGAYPVKAKGAACIRSNRPATILSRDLPPPAIDEPLDDAEPDHPPMRDPPLPESGPAKIAWM